MKKALYIGLAGLLFIYLLLNIIASQSISPLYFDLARQDTDASVSFLQYIKSFPEFLSYKDRFDPQVQEQFKVEEERQAREIERLEELLKQNPEARDVLYNLYLLHAKVGNFSQSQEYLRRAQAVDPTVE